jgi:hypothetical protein
MIGGVALAASAALYVASLAAVRRADRAYPSTNPVESTWWFGYARDSANMLGFLTFSGSFALAGLPGPLAFLAGASLTLIVYGLDFLFGRRRGGKNAALATLAAALVLVLAAAALRAHLATGLAGLVEILF